MTANKMLFCLAGIALVLAPTILCGCTTTRETAEAPKPVKVEEPYYNLGTFHREVATASPEAQKWFDRGLLLSYGFNHEEAIRCFGRAVKADPKCAMAYWGIAYASGPNINNTAMDEVAVARAYHAMRTASSLASRAPAVERRLIAALGKRYAPPPGPADRRPLDAAYTDSMRVVFRDFPNDADVAALFAESVMVLRPWNHWSKEGVPAPETPEIVAALETGLAVEPDHPGLCHFYIHTMEASPFPGKALAAADRLRNRAPEAGHLVHMPSHIDILVGQYEDAIIANQRAIVADTKYLEHQGAMNFYTLYRVHNYHFLTYGAMFDGQSEVALAASREMVRQIPDELLEEWPDFLEAFLPTPYHVLVRFGRWDEILAEPRPADDLSFVLAMWHYARGIALATLGRVEEAEAEQRAFETAAAAVPESRILFNNTCKDIMGVARDMLEGEIEYRKGNHDVAFAALREAVLKDDALNYDEPWGWMQPARHALGALLLEQDRVADAAAVYENDLGRHPNNGWALHGLAECRRRMGDEASAAELETRFTQVWDRADVEIQASCYCRVGVTE